MEHWFDNLVRNLASGEYSRRDAIKGVAALAASQFAHSPVHAAGRTHEQTGHSAQKNREAPPKPTPLALNIGPCTLVRNGLERTRHFQTSIESQGKTVSISETRYRAPGIKSTQMSISFDGGLQFQVAWHNNQFSMTLGPALGLGATTLISKDRKTITGRIDGREIAPMAMGQHLGTLYFVDGLQPPKLTESPGARIAIADAIVAAGRDAKLCATAPRTKASPDERRSLAAPSEEHDPHGGTSNRGSSPRLLPMSWHVRSPNENWQTSPPPNGVYFATPGTWEYPEGSAECQLCQSNCSGALSSCQSDVQTACGLLGGVAYYWCTASGFNIFCGSGDDCYESCGYPGPGPCCPIPCQGCCCSPPSTCIGPNSAGFVNGCGVCCPGGGTSCGTDDTGTALCCRTGDTCIELGLCCPKGQVVCQGQCCPPGWGCSNEGICCPGVQPTSCSGTCCASGSVCAHFSTNSTATTCCKPSDICGSLCCAGGSCLNNTTCCPGQFSIPCGDKCCFGLGTTCCNSECCFGQCINGTCCPTLQVCGDVCCAAGQNCSGGKCVTVSCTQFQISCISPMLDGPPQTICCRTPTCCNGQCCAPKTVCCTNRNNAIFGCTPKADCAVNR
jgi:hypothetical protein